MDVVWHDDPRVQQEAMPCSGRIEHANTLVSESRGAEEIEPLEAGEGQKPEVVLCVNVAEAAR